MDRFSHGNTSNRPYIYIIFSPKDRERIMPLIRQLEEMGFAVKYDDGIEARFEWPEYVANEIKNSEYVLTFLSDNTMNSPNARQEVSYAMQCNKKIVTAYLDDVRLPSGMAMQLHASNAIQGSKEGLERAIEKGTLRNPDQDADYAYPSVHACPSAPAEPAPESGRNVIMGMGGMIGSVVGSVVGGMVGGIAGMAGALHTKLNEHNSPATKKSAPPIVDSVQFRAAAPARIKKDSYALVKIMAYREEDTAIADREVKRLGDKIKENTGGTAEVARKTRLQIRLQSSDVEIEEDTAEIVWNGQYTSCDFEIHVPADYDKSQIRLKGRVYQDYTVLTDIRLILEVDSERQQEEIPVEKCRLSSAFVSYASQDRDSVMARIQGIQVVQPDMDLFIDVVKLRRGEKWEPRLYKEIDGRDLFYLFWSRNAANSPWVAKELQHALQAKGEDAIEPIPLEDPEICPPPESLQSRHFNDWTLRYISNKNR